MGRTQRKRKNKHTQTNNNVDIIELLKWLRLKHLQLRIQDFSSTGRGIQALKPVAMGEVLVAIPLSRLLTVENFTHSQILHYVWKYNWSEQTALSLILLNEKYLGTDSNFYVYIQLLPPKYSNLYFCSEKEIGMLPELFKSSILTQKELLKREFTKIKSKLEQEDNFKAILDFDKFVWSWFTINSRSVFYKGGMALAPFLDMFNHSENAQIEVCVDEKNGLYTLRSLQQCNRYDQVFIKYGPHANDKLLLEYGFIIEDNPQDCVMFTFQMVLQAATNCIHYDATKTQDQFIRKNNLDKQLWKNRDGYSWNMKTLVYVLTSDTTDSSKMAVNVFSQSFTDDEECKILQICETVAHLKWKELHQDLNNMLCIEDCTHGFEMCKSLVGEYLNILCPASQ